MARTKEQEQAVDELIANMRCIKGIVSKGARKGKPYTLTTVDKATMFSSMLFKVAELAGVEVIDNTVDEE